MDETLSLVEKFLDFSRRSNLGPELCLEPGCVHVVDRVQRHRLHTHRLPDLLDRRYVIRLVRVGESGDAGREDLRYDRQRRRTGGIRHTGREQVGK